jgi:hypothetical protein
VAPKSREDTNEMNFLKQRLRVLDMLDSKVMYDVKKTRKDSTYCQVLRMRQYVAEKNLLKIFIVLIARS